MTLVDQSSTVTYTGNSATTVWDYDFIIPDEDSARVGLFVIATGVLTLLDASDYEITGINDDNGGTVTYPLMGSPLANDTRIVIWREVPYEQATEQSNQTPYYASVLERQLDLIVMQIQQLRDEADRAIKVTLGSDLTPDEFVEDLQEGAAEAQASATAAAESADAAAASAATINLPTIVADTYLRAASDASGYETKTPAEVYADLGFPTPVALNYLRRNAGNTAYESRTPTQVADDVSALSFGAAQSLSAGEQEQLQDNGDLAARLGDGTLYTTVLGANYEITGLDADMKAFEIVFSNLRNSAASGIYVALGYSGGYTAGFNGHGTRMAATSLATAYQNSGLQIHDLANNTPVGGRIFGTLLDPATNLWQMSLSAAYETSTVGMFVGSTTSALGGVVDRLRFVAGGGGNIIANGLINLRTFK